MHCLYRSNMHVLVLQTGIIAAVYGDSDNEVWQKLLLGILVTSGLWWVLGCHLMALKASMGPQGCEEVSLSLHCLASFPGVRDNEVTFTTSQVIRRGENISGRESHFHNSLEAEESKEVL